MDVELISIQKKGLGRIIARTAGRRTAQLSQKQQKSSPTAHTRREHYSTNFDVLSHIILYTYYTLEPLAISHRLRARLLHPSIEKHNFHVDYAESLYIAYNTLLIM